MLSCKGVWRLDGDRLLGSAIRKWSQLDNQFQLKQCLMVVVAQKPKDEQPSATFGDKSPRLKASAWMDFTRRTLRRA